MPKPSDFFIGLVDFIAVILPGAILGFLLILLDWPDRVKEVLAERLADPVAGWAAFLTLAYVLGHVLHHLGTFLDAPVYDWAFCTWRRHKLGWMTWPPSWRVWYRALRTGTYPGEARKTPRKLFDPVGPPTDAHRRATWFAQWQARAEGTRFGETRPPASDPPAGDPQPAEDRPPEFKPGDESVYGWAAAYVRLTDPAAAAELDRAGVDSKFFRSLFFITPFLVWVIHNRLYAEPTTKWLTVTAVLLGVFSLYRFCDRRWAAAEETYRYFVLLALAASKQTPSEPQQAPGAPTR